MKKNVPYLFSILLATGLLLTGCGRDPVTTALREYKRGHFANAEKILLESLQEDPSNIDALANSCILHLKNGDQARALAGFLQVAEEAPNDPRPLEYAASIYMDNNRWAEATALLNEADRRAPRSPSIQTAMALVDLNTTGAIVARDRLLRIISDTPAYAPALFNLGVIHRDWLKNTSEAKKYFQRYLAIEKNDSHVVIARAAMTEKGPKPPTVTPPPAWPSPGAAPKSTLKPVQSPNPKVASEAFSQGVRHHQARESEQAIEAYTRAIQLDPAMVRAHYNLGLILRDKRDLDQARRSFEHALSIAPGMADARYMMALVLIDQGQDAEAAKHLSTLLDKTPQHAEAHLALGLLYKKDPAKGDLARKELNAYLKLDPNGSAAKEIRNWLTFPR